MSFPFWLFKFTDIPRRLLRKGDVEEGKFGKVNLGVFLSRRLWGGWVRRKRGQKWSSLEVGGWWHVGGEKGVMAREAGPSLPLYSSLGSSAAHFFLSFLASWVLTGYHLSSQMRHANYLNPVHHFFVVRFQTPKLSFPHCRFDATKHRTPSCILIGHFSVFFFFFLYLYSYIFYFLYSIYVSQSNLTILRNTFLTHFLTGSSLGNRFKLIKFDMLVCFFSLVAIKIQFRVKLK